MKDDKLIQLINNNIISFNELLLDNYSKIGLNETEAVLLIKLNNSLKMGINKLEVKNNSYKMTLTESELQEKIIDLVYRDYINIEISSINGSEVYSLDATLKKLIMALNDEKIINTDSVILETVKVIEEYANKEVSSNDLEIIQRWYKDYNYSKEEIDEAIEISNKNKKVSARYIDRVLANRKRKTEVSVNNELSGLFDDVYGK